METNGQDKKKHRARGIGDFDDGTIVEMVFRPDLRRTLFAIFSAGRWTLQDAIDLGFDARLVPFSANNNLIKIGRAGPASRGYMEARRSS